MLQYVGIILLIEFSKCLESFCIIWLCIRYRWHKKFSLLFIEPPCTYGIHQYTHTYTPPTCIHTHHIHAYITYTPPTRIHTHYTPPTCIRAGNLHTYTDITHHLHGYIHTTHTHTYTPPNKCRRTHVFWELTNRWRFWNMSMLTSWCVSRNAKDTWWLSRTVLPKTNSHLASIQSHNDGTITMQRTLLITQLQTVKLLNPSVKRDLTG